MSSEKSAHSHPNYVKIWAILLVLLVISILGPMLEVPAVTLVTAFGIAIVKATMVTGWFMHMNVERRYIWYLMFAMLAFLLVLFAGLAPDVLNHSGANWTKQADTTAH